MVKHIVEAVTEVNELLWNDKTLSRVYLELRATGVSMCVEFLGDIIWHEDDELSIPVKDYLLSRVREKLKLLNAVRVSLENAYIKELEFQYNANDGIFWSTGGEDYRVGFFDIGSETEDSWGTCREGLRGVLDISGRKYTCAFEAARNARKDFSREKKKEY